MKKKFKDSWAMIKPQLMREYPVLKEDELEYVMGHEEDLIQRISTKTGVPRDEIMKKINSFTV